MICMLVLQVSNSFFGDRTSHPTTPYCQFHNLDNSRRLSCFDSSREFFSVLNNPEELLHQTGIESSPRGFGQRVFFPGALVPSSVVITSLTVSMENRYTHFVFYCYCGQPHDFLKVVDNTFLNSRATMQFQLKTIQKLTINSLMILTFSVMISSQSFLTRLWKVMCVSGIRVYLDVG